MTKKEVCNSNNTFAYYSGLGGLEFRCVEYGIETYVYCVSGAWVNSPSYHKLKICYDKKGNDYIKLHGYKIPLCDCIRA